MHRFERKIRKQEDGHWIWTGAHNNKYGNFKTNGRSVSAHRFSMHLYRGFDLNSSKFVLHKNECNTRLCVNPDHLYIGDHYDNMRDASSLNTHCPQGHEFTKENTRYGKTRDKHCRTCDKIHNSQRS